MGIVIHNYLFPIYFSYKSWYVKMDEVKCFFKKKDLKVKVEIRPSLGEFINLLAQFTGQTQTVKEVQKLAADFTRSKQIVYTFNVNGGFWDRFFGENISATENAKKQVLNYIDNHLGDAEDEFRKYLKGKL